MKTASGIAIGLLVLLAVAALAAGSIDATAGAMAPVQIQVIASSDHEADQQLKLAVRDQVLTALGPKLNGLSPDEGRNVLVASLPEVEHVAQSAVAAAGFQHGVTVEFGMFQHDGRRYGPIVAEAGAYDILRISIGEADGANWWCVLLPPVCFAQTDGGLSVVSEDELAAMLELDANGQWVLRTDAAAAGTPRLRLAVIEWLRQLETPPRLAWLQRLIGSHPLFSTVTRLPS